MAVVITSSNMTIGNLPLPWGGKPLGMPFPIITRFKDSGNTFQEKSSSMDLPPSSHFLPCDGQLVDGGTYPASIFAGKYIPNFNGSGLGDGGFVPKGGTTDAGRDNVGTVPDHSHTISGTFPAENALGQRHRHYQYCGNPWNTQVQWSGTFNGETGNLPRVCSYTGIDSNEHQTQGGIHTHTMSGTTSSTGGNCVVPKNISVNYYIRIL